VLRLRAAGGEVERCAAALRRRAVFLGGPADGDAPGASFAAALSWEEEEEGSRTPSSDAEEWQAGLPDEGAVHVAVRAALRAALAAKRPPPPQQQPPPAPPAHGGASEQRLLRAVRGDAQLLVSGELGRRAAAGGPACHHPAAELVTSAVALLMLLRALADAPGSVPAEASARALEAAAEALRPRAAANAALYERLMRTLGELKSLLAVGESV